MGSDASAKRRRTDPPGHSGAAPGLGHRADACPRCATGLFPVELNDAQGHRVSVLHCLLCGTYVEPGHVPDTAVVRTVRGPRGPRK